MFSFSEDMLPRHFPMVHLPKSVQQINQPSDVIPQPTLPSVSLIFSNEENVQHKNTLQKSSTNDTLMKYQSKALKKQVRFKTYSQSCNIDRDIPTERKESTYVCSNLESTFSESQWKNQHYWPQRNKLKTIDKITNETQTSERVNRSLVNTNFRQCDDFLKRSDLIKEKFLSRPSLMPDKNQQRSHKLSKIPHQEATNVGFGFHGMIEQYKQMQSCDEILLNILEEQQQHISIQQHQILMQEKQSLEQQKQISILQRQIDHLLLQNEADDIGLQKNGHKFVTGKEISAVDVLNVLETKNCAAAPMNLDCQMYGRIEYVSREENSTIFGIEKMIPHIGLSRETMRSDILFDRTDNAITTSAIFNHKINELVSLNRTSDVNIKPQAFLCEANTNNISYTNSQIATDRSFVLNMLGMKYRCSEDKGSLQRLYYNQPRNERNSENIPSDMNVYEYLVRHGLVKDNFTKY